MLSFGLHALDHILKTCPKPHVQSNWTPDLKRTRGYSKHYYRSWVAGGKIIDISNPLKVAYKNAFRREFRKYRRSEVEQFYQAMDPLDPQKNLGLSSSSSPSLVFHNQLYMDGGGLPDAWASYFSELYTPNPNRYDQENLSIINDAVNRLCLSLDIISGPIVFSADDIKTVLLRLRKKKASGPDYLSNEHLIYCPSIIHSTLAGMFNSILRLQYVPSVFAQSLFSKRWGQRSIFPKQLSRHFTIF